MYRKPFHCPSTGLMIIVSQTIPLPINWFDDHQNNRKESDRVWQCINTVNIALEAIAEAVLRKKYQMRQKRSFCLPILDTLQSVCSPSLRLRMDRSAKQTGNACSAILPVLFALYRSANFLVIFTSFHFGDTPSDIWPPSSGSGAHPVLVSYF